MWWRERWPNFWPIIHGSLFLLVPLAQAEVHPRPSRITNREKRTAMEEEEVSSLPSPKMALPRERQGAQAGVSWQKRVASNSLGREEGTHLEEEDDKLF